MFKEIEIKGLVTKMTLVEIDEETVNRVKSVFDNKGWIETYEVLDELLLSDDREEFIHVTRQGIEMQAAEYKVRGDHKRTFNSKTPVEQVKTIRDGYKGKYAIVQSMIGFALMHGNIKCEIFEPKKLKFTIEYWKGIDELISCDTIIYDGEVYELDEHHMTEEALTFEVGKFNQQGYFERILRLAVK